MAAAGANAPAAFAGTIEVGACQVASSPLAPSTLWTASVPDWAAARVDAEVPESCSEVQPDLQLKVTGAGDGTVPWNYGMGISATSPFPRAFLTGFEGAWMTNPALPAGWRLRAIAFNDMNDQPIVASCVAPGPCSAWSTSGTRVTLPSDTRSLKWEALCGGSPCAASLATWLWRSSRMVLSVTDPDAPVLVDGSATGAALTAPASWLRGTQRVSIRSDDPGGLGVEATSVLVDGSPVASASTAECYRLWSPGGWCSERVVTSATLATAGLADGEHDLVIEAIDASGNRSERRSTFRVDNHGDSPSNVTVGPASWTTTNAFALAWENPAGSGAPIAAAHVTRCDADGADCETTRIAGADLDAVSAIAVPAAGAWRLAVALEDAAGNIGPATAAGQARLAAVPTVTVAPTVSGSAREGEELTIDAGTWSGVPAPVVEQEVLMCDENGDDCDPFATPAGGRVQLRPEHVGATFRVEVTARNAGGQRTERSAPSAIVTARPPLLTTPPRTSAPRGSTEPAPVGAAVREAIRIGGRLGVDGDAWDGTDAMVVAVQWQQCNDAGTDCGAIPDAIERTYEPSRADVGHAVRAEIRASNMAGSATAVTDPVLVLAAAEDPPASGGGDERPPIDATPIAAPSTSRVGVVLSVSRPTARCVGQLRERLAGTGRLTVSGSLPGTATIAAGGRPVLTLRAGEDAVTIRTARGRLLGVSRGVGTVALVRRGPARVSARALDGSLLVAIGTQGKRVVIKGRSCIYTTATDAQVAARVDRPTRATVYLTTDTGTPVSNALVDVVDGTRRTTVRTDEAGQAALQLDHRAGSRTVTLAFAGDDARAPATLPVAVAVRGTTTLTGSVTTSRAQLRGRVTGAPEAAVTVAFLDAQKRWRPLAEATADRAGRWSATVSTPRVRSGGPQLVLRATVDGKEPFARRTGGQVRLDVQMHGRGR